MYAFDCLFEGAFPPAFEDRTYIRARNRVAAELGRYQQIGRCSGWIEVDGERTEMAPDSWVSPRDHSWGVRYGVGLPMHGLEPQSGSEAYHFFWSPGYRERPDGSAYGVSMVINHFRGPGLDHKATWGTIEHPDGRIEQTTGFHRGTGLYFGLDGHHHGEWRGELHVDGDRFEDRSTPETACRVHQIRDTVVRLTDPVGGGVGWDNWQPMVTGAHPELGLDAQSSFT